MIFADKRRTIIILAAIIILGALLRLWSLGSAELIFDEGLYAFRSIGYLDYLESALQSTPIQWLADAELPWWTNLSFHDHPPLFFIIQKFFFLIFGDSLLVSRLPSALAGIASILLIFLITRKLSGSDFSGLAAALVWSIAFAPVSVSRLSMMEGILFPTILLNIYFFLRLVEKPASWFLFGLTLGLVFLTKYIGLFLIPVYLVYLAATRPSLIKNKHFYFALIVAAVIFLPVIAYNINLYRAVGHFDLQFSYLFGQEAPEWQGASGKTQEPFSALGENFFILFSKPLFAAAIASFAVLLAALKFRREKWLRAREGITFVLALVIFITLLLAAVGSAIRFTALYVIPIALSVGFAVPVFRERAKRRGWRIVLAVFAAALVVFEAAFTINRTFANAPNYGVAELDRYFDRELGEGRGPGLPSHPNPHLDRIIQKHGAKLPSTLPLTGLIYDDDIGTGPLLWVFSRRQYYHGIPVMPASAFLETIKAKGSEAFKGFTLYFAAVGPAAPLKPGQPTEYGEETARMLGAAGEQVPDLEIKDAAGNLAFAVYKILVE